VALIPNTFSPGQTCTEAESPAIRMQELTLLYQYSRDDTPVVISEQATLTSLCIADLETVRPLPCSQSLD